MFVHAAEFMAIALDARDRAADARRSDQAVMAPDALVSVVMAAAATEAFINELGEYYTWGSLPIEKGESACGVALAEIEKSRGSTELKYLVASLSLSGRMFDKGTQPFQDFSTLMTIRNHLMHPKPERDQFGDGVSVPPAYVRDFERRGMTCPREPDVSVSWLNLLETELVASWACQAAVEIIVALAAMTPPGSATAMFGRPFAEHYRTRAHEPGATAS